MNHNEQHQYTNSAVQIAEKVKKAKFKATIVTFAVFLVIVSVFFHHRWKENSDVDYIDGNVLKIARSGSATTGSVWTSASFVGQLAWSGLFYTDATFTEVNPELAESIEVSANGLTYTIVLKENLYWSDGQPLTLDDVVFSIESVVLCPSASNAFVNALYQIKGVEAWQEVGVESWENGGTHSLEGLSVDGNTLTITLENPYSSFAMSLTQFVILPKHILEDKDPSMLTDSQMTDFFTKPVSSGMYMVDCVNEDGDLELIHNPYYHGEHSDIERVIMYGEYQTMYIDYYTTSSTPDMVSYRNMAGFDEYVVNVLFYRYFVFNLLGGYNYEGVNYVPSLDSEGNQILDDDGEVVMVADYDDDREENLPMQNYLLRQAISLAIDRESLAKDVYLGNAESDFSLSGNEKYTEFLADYDIAKAKALLQESGYDLERPLKIAHYHTDANSMALLARIQESLESIGLTVEVQQVSGTVAMYETREYDILLKGYAAQNSTEWYVEYLSTANSISDLLGTDEFDDLIVQLEGATSIDAYSKVWAEMQELDRNTMYRMPIVTTTDCTYINGNRVYVPEDMEFGNVRYRSDLRLSEWYVKKG